MGVFDAVRGRDDNGRMTQSVVDTTNFEESKHAQSDAAGTNTVAAPPVYDSQTPSDSDSAFGVNGVLDDEQEVKQNPDHVTDKAGLGQQKAEAAALVWSRPAVAGIYAW